MRAAHAYVNWRASRPDFDVALPCVPVYVLGRPIARLKPWSGREMVIGVLKPMPVLPSISLPVPPHLIQLLTVSSIHRSGIAFGNGG
jgi:hypothetical protein